MDTCRTLRTKMDHAADELEAQIVAAQGVQCFSDYWLAVMKEVPLGEARGLLNALGEHLYARGMELLGSRSRLTMEERIDVVDLSVAELVECGQSLIDKHGVQSAAQLVRFFKRIITCNMQDRVRARVRGRRNATVATRAVAVEAQRPVDPAMMQGSVTGIAEAAGLSEVQIAICRLLIRGATIKAIAGMLGLGQARVYELRSQAVQRLRDHIANTSNWDPNPRPTATPRKTAA